MELQGINDALAVLGGAPASQDSIRVIERALLTLPQVDLNTTHALSGECYARTIVIPAGTMLTGAVHNKDHVNIMFGDITVSTDEGMRRLTGYHVLSTKAGMKRVGITHADTAWTTVMHTTLTDIKAIEDEATNESAMLQTRTLNLQNAASPQLEG